MFFYLFIKINEITYFVSHKSSSINGINQFDAFFKRLFRYCITKKHLKYQTKDRFGVSFISFELISILLLDSKTKHSFYRFT